MSNVILSVGSYGKKVTKLQERYSELGYNIEIDGEFGGETKGVTREFQINATYALDGSLLPITGSVDQDTWDLLFAYEGVGPATVITPSKPSGIYSSPITSANINTAKLSPLGKAIIKYAQQEVGTKEVGTNGGKRVNEYLATVGLRNSGAPWCMAFVMWCYVQACNELGIPIIWERPRAITMQKSGHVQGYKNWADSKGILITSHRLALPSSFFVMVFSGGSGHTGIIIRNDTSKRIYTTIEGNTNAGGSREGDGVYIKQRRYDSIHSVIQFKEIYLLS